MKVQFEIVDENGNIHGPFSDMQSGVEYAEDRGLGEQQISDDERAPGWYFRHPARSDQ